MILQYHSVNHPDRNHFDYVHPSLSVCSDDFDRQLAFLSRHFHVVTLEKLIAHVNGECRISGQVAAITFDDGYKDNYLYAFPLLLKHGFSAMFYLTTDCIDEKKPIWTSELRNIVLRSPKLSLILTTVPATFSIKTDEERSKTIRDLKAKMLAMAKGEREEVLAELRKEAGMKADDRGALGEVMLSWKDVKFMRRYGMQFGAHTLTHPSLPNIPRDEARAEILTSKEVLEERLSEEIRHFSYPNPGDMRHSSPHIAEMVKDAGFSSATTSIPGRVAEGDEVFQLKRKGIYALFGKLPDFYFWLQKEALADMGRRFCDPKLFGKRGRVPLNENLAHDKSAGAFTCMSD